MLNVFKNKFSQIHKQSKEAKELLRFIGPGILVTVGFIDPGNWAANLAAGADYGYALLWVVTLSTLMLILLQHNVAHLGIVTGECLSEAATRFLPKRISRPILVTAIMAAQATALAEILGAAIALNMLFGIPIMAGAVITAVVCTLMLWTNSYSRLETWIAGFVSVIAMSYFFEISECRNKLCGIITAPKILITTSIEPAGILGTVQLTTACGQSTCTIEISNK